VDNQAYVTYGLYEFLGDLLTNLNWT